MEEGFEIDIPLTEYALLQREDYTGISCPSDL